VQTLHPAAQAASSRSIRHFDVSLCCAGVGKTVLIMELINNVAKGHGKQPWLMSVGGEVSG